MSKLTGEEPDKKIKKWKKKIEGEENNRIPSPLSLNRYVSQLKHNNCRSLSETLISLLKTDYFPCNFSSYGHAFDFLEPSYCRRHLQRLQRPSQRRHSRSHLRYSNYIDYKNTQSYIQTLISFDFSRNQLFVSLRCR